MLVAVGERERVAFDGDIADDAQLTCRYCWMRPPGRSLRHDRVPERQCFTDDDSEVVRLVGLVVGVGVDGVRRMACELPTG